VRRRRKRERACPRASPCVGAGTGAGSSISAANGKYDQNRSPSLVADRNGNLMTLWGVHASGFGGAQEGTFARPYVAGEEPGRGSRREGADPP